MTREMRISLVVSDAGYTCLMLLCRWWHFSLASKDIMLNSVYIFYVSDFYSGCNFFFSLGNVFNICRWWQIVSLLSHALEDTKKD